MHTKVIAKVAMNPSERLVAFTALTFMLCTCVMVILWGADRGIGRFDDAEYLLGARFPNDYVNQVTSVYQYTGLLFELVGYNVAKFRQIGVLVLLLSGYIFWRGFMRFVAAHTSFVHNTYDLPTLSLLLFSLASLCHYQWFYMTPNYNTLTGFSISVSVGLVLNVLADVTNTGATSRHSLLMSFLAGIFLGFLFFIKFSASITTTMLTIVVLAAWGNLIALDKIKIMSCILAGYSVAGLIHFTYIQPYHQWLVNSKTGLELYTSLALFDFNTKALSYISDFFWFFIAACASYWPAILIACGLGLAASFFKQTQAGMNTLAIAACAACGWVVFSSITTSFDITARYVNEPLLPRYILFHFSWILIIALLISPWLSRKGDNPELKNINIFLFISLLTFMPFAGSVGVTHALYSSAVVYPVSWFGVIIALLLLKPFEFYKIRFIRMLLVFGLGGITSSQILFGYLYDSQQISPSTLEQDREIEVADDGNFMRLDNELASFIEELKALALSAGFEHGDDVIAVDFLQRVVYAIGGRSPIIANYASFDKSVGGANYTKRSEIALTYIDEERLSRAYILVNVSLPRAGALLRKRGLNFPDSYNGNDSYEHVGDVEYQGVYYTLFRPSPAVVNQ